MLTQMYRREVPDHDAFVERTLLRTSHFCVAVIRSRRLAVDWGVLDRAVKHVTRFRRPQLTLVLDGRGYLELRGRVLALRPGDVVTSEQALHDGEGYGGASCEVVIIDWAPGGLFGDRVPPGEVARISPADVARLRGLVRSLGAVAPAAFVIELARILRSLGLALPAASVDDIEVAPLHLARLYRALGPALSRLDDHPSITELASGLGLSERHVNRLLVELARGYDHPFEGWRDLLHGMRLGWATQLLSVPEIPLAQIAALAGYRSTIALHHACSLRGASTPAIIAGRLRDRWR